jgi:hypothetical protein
MTPATDPPLNDEHREKLERRLTPIHLFKLTPKTNCGECGYATCLAFATQVIVGQGALDLCPYLDQAALPPFRAQLADQHQAGIGVKREGFEKALQFLREEVRKWDFVRVAASLGAKLLQIDGASALGFPYLGEQVVATREDIAKAAGGELSPWEKILLYNYVLGGAVEPSGRWVGMESLPNAVAKIKSLKAHCQDKLAVAFTGKMDQLPRAIAPWGHKLQLTTENADFAAEFPILPKLAVRVFWWDEDAGEGFPAQVKFLFDAKVLAVLDLESLLFTCEQLTDRLLAAVAAET